MLWKSYSSPLYFSFVVPCGTFLNYDEDVDILIEFFYVYLIGVDWGFINFINYVLNALVLINV